MSNNNNKQKSKQTNGNSSAKKASSDKLSAKQQKKIIKHKAMDNDLICKTYSKNPRIYLEMLNNCLKKQMESALPQVEKLKFESIFGEIHPDYDLQKKSAVFNANVSAQIWHGHVLCTVQAGCTFTVNQNIKIKSSKGNILEIKENSQSSRTFNQFMDFHLNEMCKLCIKRILNRVPGLNLSLEQATELCLSKHKMKIFSVPNDFFQNDCIHECLKKNLDTWQNMSLKCIVNDLSNKFIEYFPEKAMHASVSNLKISVESDSNLCLLIELRLKIHYNFSTEKIMTYKSKSETLLPVFLLETSEGIDYKTIFSDKCFDLIIQAAHDASHSIPSFITMKKDLPVNVQNYIELGGSRPNGVSGVFKRESLKDMQYFICWDRPISVYKCTPDGSFSFSSELDAAVVCGYKDVRNKYFFNFYPINECEFIDFLDQADMIYGTFQSDTLKALPSVVFTMGDKLHMSCQVNGKRKYNMNLQSHYSPADSLKHLFNVILLDNAYNHVWLKMLNRANLSYLELEILKHIAHEGGTWLSDAKAFLNNKIHVNPSAVERDCEELCQLEYEDSTISRSLINVEYRKRKKSSSLFYALNIDLSDDVLNKVKIRQSSNADFDDFINDGKLWLCGQISSHSFTRDEKWISLQIFDSLPKSLIINFISSNEGMRFFKSFAGDDRIYAAYWLSDFGDKRCTELSKVLLSQ